MDYGQILSWVVVVVGLVGFRLVGKKVWWAWFVNLWCQILWYAYAVVTNQPAFLLSASAYTVAFAVNAFEWTRDHRATKRALKEMRDNESGMVTLPSGVIVTYNTPVTEANNLVVHARRELQLLDEDPTVIEWYIRVIKEYASFGHSGGSAWATTAILEKLLRYEPLTPITNDPSEWFYHGPDQYGVDGVWQNKRDSRLFSNDEGKTYTNTELGRDNTFIAKDYDANVSK